MNPRCADIANEGMAQNVVMHPPGESGGATKRDNADRRVGCGTARDLPRIGNIGIKGGRTACIDEIHHPLSDITVGKKGVVATCKNIDNGVADSQNIKREWH